MADNENIRKRVINVRLKKSKGESVDNCPICGEKWVSQCRCLNQQRTCENGHSWYTKTGEVAGSH